MSATIKINGTKIKYHSSLLLANVARSMKFISNEK